jgi:hypothetical protein
MQFSQQLTDLVRPDGACPVHDLELEVMLPFSARPSAPYRMDLALTYQCNDDCATLLQRPTPRLSELSTEQWKAILDRLWEAGIPRGLYRQ